MTLIKRAFQQLRSSWRVLLGIYLFVLALYLGAGILSALVPHIDLDALFGDITDTADLPFYTGFLSQIDALGWCAGATICWAAYFFLDRLKVKRPQATRFLLFAAILTTVLMLDDIFLLHEEAFSDYLGIDEKIIMLAYGLLGIAFVALNWAEIMAGEYALLILALGLLAVSIAFDQFPRRYYEDIYLLEKLEKFFEDGSKTAGIFTWLAFFARYTFGQFARLVAPASISPEER